MAVFVHLLVDRVTAAHVHLDGMDQLVTQALALQLLVTMQGHVLTLGLPLIIVHAPRVLLVLLVKSTRTPAPVGVYTTLIATANVIQPALHKMTAALTKQHIVHNCRSIDDNYCADKATYCL
ncbi:uncharacterized protein LOC134690424 [Mytilus trossulus]|uniref:uncharacterized protein LOC134690424 n=1 Tax=Mytilus trossulus TaxID=6551 RepID=UPI00300433E3